MYYLQNISLEKTDLDDLYSIFQSHDNHEIRLRAHMVILRHKGFEVNAISNVCDRDLQYTRVYIKSWIYYGLNGIFNNNYQILLNQIEELEQPIPTPPRKKINWKEVFGSFINFAFIPFGLIIKFLSFVAGKIFSIDYSEILPQNNSNIDAINVSTITGDNNVVFQEYNANNDEKIEQIANTLDEVKVILYKLTSEYENKKKSIVTSDKKIAKLLLIYNKYKNPLFRSVLITTFAIIIYYNIKIKSILVTFSILFSILVINYQNLAAYFISNQIPKTKIEDLYYESSECPLLSDVPVIDSPEIINDTLNYDNQRFYIKEKNNKLYLQVIAYRSIAQAAFQRRNLLKNNFSGSQILKIVVNDETLFGVTIGEGEINDINNLAIIQQKWNSFCKTERVKAMVKAN